MPVFKKNDEFETEIIDMNNDGEGIGHANGMAFFIKGAVIGDVILAGVTKLKKSYGYARIVRILKPSPNRVEPRCPIAGRCGGCTVQQIKYPAQLEQKQKKVLDALTRIGGIDPGRFVFEPCDDGFHGKAGLQGENDLNGDDPKGENDLPGDKIRFYDIIGMSEPFRYRNKGQYPVGIDKNGNVICGFYAKHSHDIVDTRNCLLQHDIADAVMEAVRTYLAECVPVKNKRGTSLKTGSRTRENAENNNSCIVRHILTRVGFTTHEVMVCAVISADELPNEKRFVNILQNAVDEYNSANGADYCLNSVSYNINKEDTNVILGEKVVTIAGLPFITDYIGDIQYRISPLSFYQVNPAQTEELYATALEFASPGENDTVWDLYCGIGTISLYFAKYVKKVFGIEIVPEAITDAKENAKLNGITNAEFMCGAAEDLFPKLMGNSGSQEHTPDIVVVDPPRKGCDIKLIECIGVLAPKKIVYVSCDPATLARDIKLLGDFGYEPVKIRPVDMFPQTMHIETIVELQKVNT